MRLKGNSEDVKEGDGIGSAVRNVCYLSKKREKECYESSWPTEDVDEKEN